MLDYDKKVHDNNTRLFLQLRYLIFIPYVLFSCQIECLFDPREFFVPITFLSEVLKPSLVVDWTAKS